MIAFELDRAKMRSRLNRYSLVLAAGMAFLALVSSLVVPHLIHSEEMRLLLLVLSVFVWLHIIDYVLWVGVLWRCLRRKGSAIIINQTGIVDNASDFALGQIAWEEIKSIYVWDWNSRLLLNWWTRMPIITKWRGIAVTLKDGIDFQDRLRGRPWGIKLW